MSKRFLCYIMGVFILVGAGCANITTPTGGKKDTTPPKRLTISPADSLKHTKVKRIDLTFDEYISLGDAAKEVQISPLLSMPPVVTSVGKKVTVKIVDSLLEDNTTYRVSFGTAIRDLHENNPYPAYTYTFSTGDYFDSLQLSGKVVVAGTGLPDTGGVLIMLYSGTESDSAIIRHKPKYITKADNAGNFTFKGLPARRFHIYAVKDVNDNQMYDMETDMIGFIDNTVMPGDTAMRPINLNLFLDVDSLAAIEKDTVKKVVRPGSKESSKELFSYTVNVDTSNLTKKTFDITTYLAVNFSRLATINKDKITLSYDSTGINVPQAYIIVTDTAQPHLLKLIVDWKENMAYTLKLAKGFAKDSSGADANPSKYIFRTKEDDDYGKISIHLPGKYNNPLYVLQVTADKDTIYQKPVTDTIVNLTRLKPTQYSFRIIEDRNRNGKWDAGKLFAKIQPEIVIPSTGGLTLRAGWENIVDFEPKVESKKAADKPAPKSEGKK